MHGGTVKIMVKCVSGHRFLLCELWPKTFCMKIPKKICSNLLVSSFFVPVFASWQQAYNVFMFTDHCDGIRVLKVTVTLFSLSTPHVATLYLSTPHVATLYLSTPHVATLYLSTPHVATLYIFHCAPLNAGWFRKKG